MLTGDTDGHADYADGADYTETGEGTPHRASEVGLHDATLLGIRIDWAAHTASIQLEAWRAQVEIVVSRVRRVQLTHDEPWGPSVSVNEVRRRPSQNRDCTVLEIEVQSGDVVVIEGESIEFNRTPSANSSA